MAVPHLTRMRRAVWSAIDNWAPLTTVIRRKIKHEDSGAGNAGVAYVPTIGDLPALELLPASGVTPWVLNQSQEVQYSLQLILWTKHWDLLAAEKLWEELQRCLWQSKADGAGQTYIEAQTHNFLTDGAGSIQHVALANQNGQVATRWSIPLALRWRWNPRLETEALT